MQKKLWLLIFAVSAGLCSSSCMVNPITGQQELMLISERQELEIGRKYAPEIEKQMGGRIANQSVQNYINNVGQKIARVSHRPNLEYHFVALEDKSVNAMALPGGYLFITRGMLENLESEAQLAGILAHEVVHVVARDTANAMSNQIGIDLLLSAVTSEKTPKSVLITADLARQILSLRYSRKDETSADFGGMDYMVRAGYSPYGMVETMEMLENQESVRPIEFFSTHPAPENRKRYLTHKIQANYPNVAGLIVGKDQFQKSVLEQLGN